MRRKVRLELDAPSVGELEKKYLNKAINDGYVSTIGPYVPEFERRFAKYLGMKKAVSMQSGTAALHMALYELGIKNGDEVIVPALTFVATVNPVKYVGAKPVFVDVNRDTWNIAPVEVEKRITKRTKAILPVHLYGNPCAIDEIRRIAEKYNLFVIEDATESLGVKYKGVHTGTFGDLGCYSFNGNKIITTGGGGMVAGNDEKRLDHIKFLVNQARDEKRSYYHPEVGFNYRMTNIEAALGIAQMERLDDFLSKKRRFNEIYRDELKDLKSVCFQKEETGGSNSRWLSCIIFEKDIDIASLQKKLEKEGIPTRRVFSPVVESPPYKENKKESYKNSYYIHERGLCLPSSTLNSEDDIYYVCKVLKGLI
jgi:perosamine synthetase